MATLSLQNVDNELKGRLALVTGASGGIGTACVRALAAEGCDVVLHYNSNQEKAELLVQSLREIFPSQLFVTVQADLASREGARQLFKEALRRSNEAVRTVDEGAGALSTRPHAAISILVANAGLGRRIRDVCDIGEDDWDAMMEVNARSAFVVTKACVEGMRAQRWGRIIMTGSIASRGGGINGCHYAASKGALTGMALNLATVLAPEGVTVNVVEPAMVGATGMVPTPKSSTWSSTDDLDELRTSDPGLAIAAGVPMHRLGEPEEIANMVCTIAKTGYMTGQEVVMAGGLK